MQGQLSWCPASREKLGRWQPGFSQAATWCRCLSTTGSTIRRAGRACARCARVRGTSRRAWTGVLLGTDLPTDAERKEAAALVPWGTGVFDLTTILRSAFVNAAVDVIEGSLGPPHARSALVALYEGVDVLLQAGIDLADSSAARAVLSRIDVRDPLGRDTPLSDANKAALPLRAARFRTEDAAINPRLPGFFSFSGSRASRAQRAWSRGQRASVGSGRLRSPAATSS